MLKTQVLKELRELKDLISKFLPAELDDPEDVLVDLAENAPAFCEALEVAIANVSNV